MAFHTSKRLLRRRLFRHLKHMRRLAREDRRLLAFVEALERVPAEQSWVDSLIGARLSPTSMSNLSVPVLGCIDAKFNERRLTFLLFFFEIC